MDDLRKPFLAVVAGHSSLDETSHFGQFGWFGGRVEDEVRKLAGLWTILLRSCWVAIVDQRGVLDISSGDEG